MVCICVYLTGKQRLKVYPEGGCVLEQLIDGAGWCIDNSCCDAIPALDEALSALARCKDNLTLAA